MFHSNIPTPKNASVALRLAIRHERAQQIITEGYTFHYDALLGITYVCKPGESTATYCICDKSEIVAPNGGCSCPDYQNPAHQDFCKHSLALAIYQTHQEELNFEAMCEDYDLRAQYEQ